MDEYMYPHPKFASPKLSFKAPSGPTYTISPSQVSTVISSSVKVGKSGVDIFQKNANTDILQYF